MNPTLDASSSGSSERVLIVDDSEMNRDLLSRQLARLGWTCDLAASAREALEVLEKASYSLVLTDLQMPVMDGFELAEAIRRREHAGKRRVPIVAISATEAEELADRCLAADMDGYLAKPVEMRALRECVARFVGEDAGPPPVEDAARSQRRAGAPAGGERREGCLVGLDLLVLHELVGDDAQAVREVLGEFVPHARGAVAEIRAAVASRIASEVGAVAHKLKSSARAVGAQDLDAICMRLERASAEGDWPDIERDVPRIDAALESIERQIDALLRR